MKYIQEWLLARGLDASWICSVADCNRKTVSRWFDGGAVYARNIAMLARAMRKKMQEICLDKIPSHVSNMYDHHFDANTIDCEFALPTEEMKNWSPEKQAKFLAGVQAIISVGGKITFLGVKEGSVKVVLRLTPEQWRELQRAQYEGKLASLGVSSVNEIIDPPAPPYMVTLEVPISHFREYFSPICAILSFAAGLFGAVWAGYASFAIAGLILSAIGTAMSISNVKYIDLLNYGLADTSDPIYSRLDRIGRPKSLIELDLPAPNFEAQIQTSERRYNPNTIREHKLLVIICLAIVLFNVVIIWYS